MTEHEDGGPELPDGFEKVEATKITDTRSVVSPGMLLVTSLRICG